MRTLLLALALQTPDPLVTATEALIQAAVTAGELDATVLALSSDTTGRHAICSLDGTATGIDCSRYTVTWENDAETVGRAEHVAPTEHTADAVAAMVTAERAWVDDTQHENLMEFLR